MNFSHNYKNKLNALFWYREAIAFNFCSAEVGRTKYLRCLRVSAVKKRII